MLEEVKDFLLRKWDDNTQNMWAYFPEDGINQMWPMRESLAYTNEELKTASISGFPLGDLYRWWPEEYEQWEAQKEQEWERLMTWLETGVDPEATSVREIAGGQIPADFRLSQNYPNPFNPTTQIRYSVPAGAEVSLKVYNYLGHEVATLFEGHQPMGNYVATFDASGLPSGVYFYRLQSGGTSLTKKLVLVK
jgi:hypothetical protein